MYKVNMYTHGYIHVEKDNLHTECDARHTISNVTLSSQYAHTSCGLLRIPKGYETHEDTKNTISDGIKIVQNIIYTC